MGSITVKGSGEVYPSSLTTSILNTLLKNGFPIQTECGGRAQCGRDLIRVLAGAEFLSPRRDMETRRLESLAREGEPAGPEMRLACQTYVRGDVVIEIVHRRERVRPAAP